MQCEGDDESSPFSCLLGGPYLGPVTLLAGLRSFKPQKHNSETALPGDSFSTWLVENEIHYSLFCIKDPCNENATVMVVYDQESDSLFYLRRELWPLNIPTDSVILAHYILDNIGGGKKRGNFLLFDIAFWDGKQMLGTPAPDRYSLLRQIHIPQKSILSIHFVGEKRPLQSFMEDVASGKKPLPHKVKKLIVLTEDPFMPWYE